jgi:Spy/CpxP family protein refolding chaperone
VFEKLEAKTRRMTMKEGLVIMAVAALALGAGLAIAGDKCSGGKADAKACRAGAVSNLITKLSLTDDQAAQVKGICAKYSQGERTATTASNCMSEVSKVLTPEQAAKLQAMCQGEGCPVKKAE